MNTKLTLNIEKDIIEKAKSYAKDQKISLSKMIEAYLRSLTQKMVKEEKAKKRIEVTPLVESLSGIISLSENDKDYKNDYAEFLNDKYK